MKHAVTTLLVASLVLFAACKAERAETTDTAPALTPPQASATDSATHPASPGGAALVPDVTSGTTVLVMLTEGSIAVREQTIPPGPAILTVENRGKEVHNLFIEGEGISRAAGDTIAEGSSSTVDVQFKPGTYTLYCPVLNHREQGEQTTVTIGGTPGATSTSTAPTT
jgi:plastocyanin